jgi:hypothetical protein
MTGETRSRRRVTRKVRQPSMSARELARLGDGELAYIRVIDAAEARRIYPSIESMPDGIALYALHGADGTPIALTDSRQAALGHADEVELAVNSVH